MGGNGQKIEILKGHWSKERQEMKGLIGVRPWNSPPVRVIAADYIRRNFTLAL